MPKFVPDRPRFNTENLPASCNSYVAWIDVMGIGAIMSRSLHITANFVFKLHSAALAAPREELTLYPVMDGVFVVSERQRPLLAFLEYLLSRTADVFVSTNEMHHRFLVKAALAYGPIIHGSALTSQACDILSTEDAYKGSLLLGMPMIQSYQSEKKAPPFGVYIHESARSLCE